MEKGRHLADVDEDSDVIITSSGRPPAKKPRQEDG